MKRGHWIKKKFRSISALLSGTGVAGQDTGLAEMGSGERASGRSKKRLPPVAHIPEVFIM